MKRLPSILLGTFALILSGCDSAPSVEEPSFEERLQDDLAKTSYVRQCKMVAVVQSVPDDAAEPICECTVAAVFEGRTKAEVDAMSEEVTMNALNSCIDQYKADGGETPKK